MEALLRVEEAAELLKVSRWTVYRLIKERELVSVKVRNGRRVPGWVGLGVRPIAHRGRRLMGTVTALAFPDEDPKRANKSTRGRVVQRRR